MLPACPVVGWGIEGLSQAKTDGLHCRTGWSMGVTCMVGEDGNTVEGNIFDVGTWGRLGTAEMRGN